MKGIGVSPGISIGRACVIRKKAAVLTGVLLKDEAAVVADIAAYDAAVGAAVREVEFLIDSGKAALPPESLEILGTQVEFLADSQIRSNVVKKISADKKNVSDALIEVIGETVQLFRNMEDDYLSARASDIQDIGERLLKHLPISGEGNSFGILGQMGVRPLPSNTILIAEDLSPSETITMDTTQVIGFATIAGGKTSHAAIIAKSRGIPAVVGCGEDLVGIADEDLVILDGGAGVVLVNPDVQTIAEYQLKKGMEGQQAGVLSALAGLPACTKDGAPVALLGNIGDAADLPLLFEKGGEGVGLLRTELLFMGRTSFPTEDEQFGFYKRIVLEAGIKPVTIRTLDIGGDKQLSYFGLPAEQNPFLGYRAIRICLDREELFMTQLRAILRASAFGNLRILFPMISNIRELRLAKKMLAKAKGQLAASYQPFDPKIATGIMIEVPSAALTADLLAGEADFFSIGTNDLCQYTLAVDRMNEKVKDLYEPYDPALLRLIRFAIEQGNKRSIPVALCGEMASDPMATLLLLGMGLTEFSMSAVSIPTIKKIINNNHLSRAREIAEKVLKMDNSEDIIAYLQEVQS